MEVNVKDLRIYVKNVLISRKCADSRRFVLQKRNTKDKELKEQLDAEKAALEAIYDEVIDLLK